MLKKKAQKKKFFTSLFAVLVIDEYIIHSIITHTPIVSHIPRGKASLFCK